MDQQPTTTVTLGTSAFKAAVTRYYKELKNYESQEVFPGRFVAKAAWEGMREAESQPILWTRPTRWLQQQKLASPSVRACVPSVVLAHT